MNTLLKLADKLYEKYASVDAKNIKDFIEKHLHKSILNASFWQGNNNISPIQKMIDEDRVTLKVQIVRNDMIGIKTIKVTNIRVDNELFHDKYQSLGSQIEKYLNDNPGIFPKYFNNEPVNYSHFATTIKFEPKN